MADISSCPGVNACRLRVVIAGISLLVWRRLLISATTTIAQLHAIVQSSFGWSGEHLHRFVIGGTEYGIGYVGGPGFREDARQVSLAALGLREGERFAYEYNFSAAWCVDLRVEQIACAQPGWAYPRCTGGRRAGPPEDWDGPWHFLEQAPVRRRLSAGHLKDGQHPGQDGRTARAGPGPGGHTSRGTGRTDRDHRRAGRLQQASGRGLIHHVPSDIFLVWQRATPPRRSNAGVAVHVLPGVPARRGARPRAAVHPRRRGGASVRPCGQVKRSCRDGTAAR